MAAIRYEDLLAKVKSGLGLTGAHHDETLKVYIDEVKEYMVAAGIDRSVVDSVKAVGCILRGVSDLWNYGEGQLSPYFDQRVVQLAYETKEEVADGG